MERDRPQDLLCVFEPWTPRDTRGSADPSRSPAMFLRESAIPEIGRLASRLRATGHRAGVQDLLDLPDAMLRVLFWPSPSAMAEGGARPPAALELTVRSERPDRITARYRRSLVSAERAFLASVPVRLLDLEWVRGRVLDFVETVLDEA